MNNSTDQEKTYKYRWWTLAVLCLSLVIVVAANAALNVALPTMAMALGASQTELQWFADIYILVFSGLLMPFGALGDRYGRKRMLQIGLTIFASASFVALFVDSVLGVMAIRATMGLGAALIMPSTLSLISAVFSGEERSKAISIWVGFAGAGAGIGLIISGTLLQHFPWQSTFLVNTPLVALALITGFWLVPESKDSEERPIDWGGATLLVGALSSLIYLILEVPALGFVHQNILISGVISAVLWFLFVRHQKHTTNSLFELSWFEDRRFSVGAMAVGLMFFAMIGWFFLSTQFFQYVLGYTALQAGFAAIFLSITQVVAAPYATSIKKRIGGKNTIVFGFVIVAIGFLVAASATTPSSSFIPLAIAQILMGCGLPWSMGPATAQVLDSLPSNKMGVGSAMNDTFRQMGAALGIALLGSISTFVYRQGVDVSGLEDKLAEVALGSLPGAISVSEYTNDPAAFVLQAREAFGVSFMSSILFSAVIILVAALIVFFVGFERKSQIEGAR